MIPSTVSQLAELADELAAELTAELATELATELAAIGEHRTRETYVRSPDTLGLMMNSDRLVKLP